MNNKLIGILIIILYFANFHICELIYPNNINNWIKLKFALLSLCFLLAIHYKSRNCFTEKLFVAIVINNIFVLIRHSEISYTMNDLIFITSFTAIQYAKQLYRNYSEYIFRNLAIYFNIKKPK
jgi:hypothetical protein